MKICFPVLEDKGVKSVIHKHFGSAPMFILIETKSGSVASMTNSDQDHEHGACKPLKALNGRKIDAIVVSGIGAGALTKLNRSGIKVYYTQAPTVQENVDLLKNMNLSEFRIQQCCAGHGFESACKHY